MSEVSEFLIAAIDHLSSSEREEIYDRLSLEDSVIRNVVTQIVNGETQMRSCGAEYRNDAWTEYPSALGVGRRYMYDNAEAATKALLEDLKPRLAAMEKHNKFLQMDLDIVKQAAAEQLREIDRQAIQIKNLKEQLEKAPF